MKNTIWILGALSIATVLTACNPSDSSASQSDTSVSDQLDRAQSSASDAQNELSAYTHAQKEQFVDNLTARIAALDKELDELREKVSNSSAAVQEEARPQITALRVQSDRLKEQLAQARGTSASNWDSFKSGVNNTYEDLKTGFQNTRQWMSEKIAP
ncbi:MAG: hypothetical protein JJU20_06190 [Opitutales bacterium]|nr:hypothetical protein [Opitutales bacterium]